MIRPVRLNPLVALGALGAVGAATALTAPASSPAAPSARSAAACTKTREGQKLQVTLAFRYRSTLSRVDQGVLRENVLQDTTRPFASLSIGGATCKRPRGGWRVIDPIGVGYVSAGLNAAGKIRGKDLVEGWGVGIKSGAGGSIPRIDLQVMHCGKGNFFNTIKTLNGVPIPGLSYAVSVVRWAAGGLLPKGKVQCGDVGTKRLRLVPRRDGTLRLVDLNPLLDETKFIQGTNGNFDTHKQFRVLPVIARAR